MQGMQLPAWLVLGANVGLYAAGCCKPPHWQCQQKDPGSKGRRRPGCCAGQHSTGAAGSAGELLQTVQGFLGKGCC